MTSKLSILGVALLIFVALAIAVIARNSWLTALDWAVLQTAVTLRSSALTAVMEGATFFGTWVVYLILLVVGLTTGKHRPIQYLIIALVSLTLAQIARFLINLTIHRPRPPHSYWLVHANLYSFPSGHTALAGVGYGLAAWLIWIVNRRAGMAATVAAIAIACLVAISRVYLGVHWASDVVGSLVFAAAWVTLTIILAGVLVPR